MVTIAVTQQTHQWLVTHHTGGHQVTLTQRDYLIEAKDETEMKLSGGTRMIMFVQVTKCRWGYVYGQWLGNIWH